MRSPGMVAVVLAAGGDLFGGADSDAHTVEVREDAAAAAPGLDREPHVRLMGMAGAVTLLLAVGGFFVACDAEPASPPSVDLDRELGEW